eukprot:gene12928-12446_t
MSGDGTCRSTIPDPKPSKAQAAKAQTWATSLKGAMGATVATIAAQASPQRHPTPSLQAPLLW